MINFKRISNFSFSKITSDDFYKSIYDTGITSDLVIGLNIPYISLTVKNIKVKPTRREKFTPLESVKDLELFTFKKGNFLGIDVTQIFGKNLHLKITQDLDKPLEFNEEGRVIIYLFNYAGNRIGLAIDEELQNILKNNETDVILIVLHPGIPTVSTTVGNYYVGEKRIPTFDFWYNYRELSFTDKKENIDNLEKLKDYFREKLGPIVF